MKSTNPIYQPGYFAERFRNEAVVPASPEQLAAQKAHAGEPGLGDRAHRILGPIGRALHWPCLKGDGTIDLKPGSPCDKARNFLNKITP